jgi:hypothetical protein
LPSAPLPVDRAIIGTKEGNMAMRENGNAADQAIAAVLPMSRWRE